MTVLERTRKKIIHAIENDTDIDRILQIEDLYFDNKNPLAYSVEEVRDIAQKFVDENISGTFVGIPHEEVLKEYDFL